MRIVKILFNWMRKVKHLCSELKYGCPSCPFYTNADQAYNNCKLKNLVWQLSRSPSEWDVDAYEKEWNEE